MCWLFLAIDGVILQALFKKREALTDCLVATLHPAEKAPPRKRPVASPRDGFMLENVKPETITAIPYDIIKEGVQT